MRRCRTRKPSTETLRHRANRAEYFAELRALRSEGAESAPLATRQLAPQVECCAKATFRDCACGGARVCPEHGGPVCFGKFSHD
ncbi:hypothetical protein [Corallococcus sp. EGB]|uniref:hypothetical protein n=1 Tax=Corallococcus sp. EGB TaxID=1521117 RepID=UPI001CBC4BFE|nr:hypothetical protein [Corallococcus sp. EGB]